MDGRLWIGLWNGLRTGLNYTPQTTTLCLMLHNVLGSLTLLLLTLPVYYQW